MATPYKIEKRTATMGVHADGRESVLMRGRNDGTWTDREVARYVVTKNGEEIGERTTYADAERLVIACMADDARTAREYGAAE